MTPTLHINTVIELNWINFELTWGEKWKLNLFIVDELQHTVIFLFINLKPALKQSVLFEGYIKCVLTCLNINLNFGPSVSLPMKPHVLPQNIYTIANCNSISSAIITWDKVAGANAYVVEARGNRKDFYNCTSANTSCTLTDLDCGESLSVWIVATMVNALLILCWEMWQRQVSDSGHCGNTMVFFKCNIYSGIEICTYKKVLWHGIRWRYYTLSLYLPL